MNPEKIGRYIVEGEIGRGGMATVFKAYDPRFERYVAVKVLPREFMHDPEFRARFNREAKTIASLEHPAIVPVYDYGEDDGMLYLVMRHMPGGSLAERLAYGALSIEESAEILLRLGSALERAHSEGIIHRDLKPSNVLFDQYGDAFLADFGIVRLTTSDSNLTASGSVVGTPTYMSPEQVYGDKEIDGRSDIYALGVILFQMLTGRLPYEADTPAKMMMKHILEPVPQILKDRPDLPPEAEQIISKALAKERDDRFASASDFSSALAIITRKTMPGADFQQQLATMQAEIAPDLSGLAAVDDETTSPPVEEPVPDEKEEEPPVAAKTAVSTPPPSPKTKPPIDSPPPELADDVLAEMDLPPAKKAPAEKPQEKSEPPGSPIPVWAWVLAGTLFLLCLCMTGIVGFVVANQDDFLADDNGTAAIVAEGSATAVAFPLIDDEEIEAATRSAGLLATRDQLAANATASAAAGPAADTPTSVEADATADLVATRESLSATRSAETAAGETPSAADPEGTRASLEATRSALAGMGEAGGITAVFGPTAGQLPHEADSLIESAYSGVNLSNFIARASVVNPYDAAANTWDFGLIFRQSDVDEEMRLVVRSDGSWSLNNRDGDDDDFIQEGEVAAYLERGENGRNDLLLIANEETGLFFLNGQFVARLDLSERTDFGNLALSTGFYGSDEQEGEVTRFESFAVWPYVPVFGPRDGELEHVDDGYIKLRSANLELRNFIAQTEFSSPYDTDTGSWDWGFAFRETENEYWLIIESNGAWTLVDRRSDDDYFIDEGIVNNLETNENNTLTLMALDDRGYFFLNDVFVAALDLSDRMDAGDVEVVAAFFEGNEIADTTTGYEDFTVWPLP